LPAFSHRDEGVSAAPGLSPGVVEDDEILLREMFNPEHVRAGEVIERAVPVEDLRARGFSVHRMKFVAPGFIKASMRERVARPRAGDAWRDEGVAKLVARTVRELRKDERQAFVVIDTAEEDNHGHASIFAADPLVGRAHARKLRGLLLPLLQKRMSVDEAFVERGWIVAVEHDR
jgi:hypothetical protein